MSNAPLWKLQKDITAAIREVDQKHIIFIEGNGWGNNYNGLIPIWDNNMAFSFHKYWNDNDDKTIQFALDLRAKHNMPIWLGKPVKTLMSGLLNLSSYWINTISDTLSGL